MTRDRVVRVHTVPLASSRAAVIEIEVVERVPRRWRLRIATWLVQLAGKLVRMRVRIVQ